MSQFYVILQFRNYSEKIKNTTITQASVLRSYRIQYIMNAAKDVFSGITTTTFNFNALNGILSDASGSSLYQTFSFPVSGTNQIIPYSFKNIALKWFTDATTVSNGGVIDLVNAVYTGGDSITKMINEKEVQDVTFPFVFDTVKNHLNGTGYTPTRYIGKLPFYSYLNTTDAVSYIQLNGSYTMEASRINLGIESNYAYSQCIKKSDLHLKYKLTVVNMSNYDIGLNVTANNISLWSTNDSSSSLGDGSITANGSRIYQISYPQYFIVSSTGAYIDPEDDSYNKVNGTFKMGLSPNSMSAITSDFRFTLACNKTLYVALGTASYSGYTFTDNVITVTATWQGTSGILLKAEAQYAVATQINITVHQDSTKTDVVLKIPYGSKTSVSEAFTNRAYDISITKVSPTMSTNSSNKTGYNYSAVLNCEYDN